MALYGINAYMSNSYYSSLLSSGSKKYGNTSANSTSELYSLMKRADMVRSKSYQKTMMEEYKKVFSGNDTGTVESENNLSAAAKKLSSSASALAVSGRTELNDRDALAEKVQTFADDYNSTVDALQKSASVDALKNGVYMTNTAKAYSGALGRIGIKVGSDNKLTLDKEAFKSADANAVKSILSGSYSFTGKTADKASGISRAAGLKAQVVSYTENGTLDYSTMLSLSSMFSERI